MEPPVVRVLGYGAAALTTLSLFPQAVKTVRSGDTSGISLRMYGLFTLGVLAWAFYGLARRDGPVVTANLLTLLPATVVLERKLRATLAQRRRHAGATPQRR